MKRIILFALVFLTGALQAQTPSFHISSDIKNMESDTYNMTVWGRGKAETKSKIPLRNGQIQFTDTSGVPLMIRITPNDEKLVKRATGGYYPVKSHSIWMIAMPGSHTHLAGALTDFSQVYPQGDKENEILTKLTRAYFPVLNASVNLTVLLNKKDHGLSDKKIAAVKKKQRRLNARANKILLSFLRRHASSVAGLYFLEDTYIRKNVDFSTVKELTGKVDPQYHALQFYQSLQNRIEAGQYQVGNQIMEIRSDRTPDGSMFSTASWKGKYYLIDFWGSWCGPCITDFPHVKALKEAFGDRLEILGVASDQEEKWRPAIEAYGLTWQHVLIGTGDQDFAALLDVRGYPTKILVGPDGKILYRGTGSGEESFDQMKALIKGQPN